MKKILGIVLVSMLIAGSAIANIAGNVYVEVTKSVNGSQVYGLPVLEMSISKAPLLIDLEFRNIFTSARGSIGIPNHMSTEMNLHIGFNLGSWFTTFSFGPEYVYEQNDQGRTAGWYFKNTLRAGSSF